MSHDVEVPLKNGHVAWVSLEDGDLAERRWSFSGGYARGYRREELCCVLMHRLILERVLGRSLTAEEEVDHRNGDGLDNRRHNLRLASRAQNQKNRKQHRNNHSGARGVYLDPKTGRWRAQIRVNGQRTNLGRFATVAEASRAYEEAAAQWFGEWLRSPDNTKAPRGDNPHGA